MSFHLSQRSLNLPSSLFASFAGKQWLNLIWTDAGWLSFLLSDLLDFESGLESGLKKSLLFAEARLGDLSRLPLGGNRLDSCLESLEADCGVGSVLENNSSECLDRNLLLLYSFLQ